MNYTKYPRESFRIRRKYHPCISCRQSSREESNLIETPASRKNYVCPYYHRAVEEKNQNVNTIMKINQLKEDVNLLEQKIGRMKNQEKQLKEDLKRQERSVRIVRSFKRQAEKERDTLKNLLAGSNAANIAEYEKKISALEIKSKMQHSETLCVVEYARKLEREKEAWDEEKKLLQQTIQQEKKLSTQYKNQIESMMKKESD